MGQPATPARTLACCSLLTIAALYIVGVVSHGVLRHIVQTAPLWIAVVLGLLRSRWSKWATLPCSVFWLFLMVLIWLFVLGWARVVSGTFSPIEVAMTLVVGISSIVGVIASLRMRSGVPALGAIAMFVGTLLLQLIAFRVSLLPGFVHD